MTGPQIGAGLTRVRVHNLAISLDGYGAGPRQTTENPLGEGGEALHDWFIPTRAFIMGRNMFGPVRLPTLGYTCSEHVASPRATRVVITKARSSP